MNNVHIALHEAKADYTTVNIDLRNRPEWFAIKVNSAGKVPALAYGGPKVTGEPSPEAFMLAESAAGPLPRRAEALQALLPPSGYAVGEWSIADAALTPVLKFAEMALENGIGTFTEDAGKQALETFRSPKFARLQKYLEDVKARPSFEESYHEVSNICYCLNYMAVYRPNYEGDYHNCIQSNFEVEAGYRGHEKPQSFVELKR
ncbi:hypothetical protein A0H81_02702 [Grifola frondosa]|uniref:GST N-terminal domain-containing protein n=1 Tax=Grifola frondosa TaxID=5627 RepID=A0A1C7MKZ1_GRIFR|nr:hypothetical protein A0H81_02702 [Grifola frondosa]